jgi:hypothetical protein
MIKAHVILRVEQKFSVLQLPTIMMNGPLVTMRKISQASSWIMKTSLFRPGGTKNEKNIF